MSSQKAIMKNSQKIGVPPAICRRRHRSILNCRPHHSTEHHSCPDTGAGHEDRRHRAGSFRHGDDCRLEHRSHHPAPGCGTLRSGGGWECTVRGGLKGVVAVSGRRYDRAGPAGLYSAVDAGDAATSMVPSAAGRSQQPTKGRPVGQ